MIFLCHYAGWPNGARLNSIVEETIAKADACPRRFAPLPPGDVSLMSARAAPGLPGLGLRRE